jgi:LYR motif-containing protein 4
VIQDYNVRFYAFRRTRQGYAENRELSGSAAQHAYVAGQEQLAVLKRQALLSQVYPATLSVMEHENIAVGAIDTRQR